LEESKWIVHFTSLASYVYILNILNTAARRRFSIFLLENLLMITYACMLIACCFFYAPWLASSDGGLPLLSDFAWLMEQIA
jgi:hypothetical protein